MHFDIKKIVPLRSKTGYRFCVNFDDETEVEVSASDLHDYRRFQRAVLAQTGRLYESIRVLCAGRASQRTTAWADEISARLASITPKAQANS